MAQGSDKTIVLALKTLKVSKKFNTLLV